MSRKGKFWKANVETTDFEVITPTVANTKLIKKLQAHIQADIVAIDILEEASGKQHIVEYNDIPGLSGFPDVLKVELAEIMKSKMIIV